MPNDDPRDGFFYPTLKLMIYYFILLKNKDLAFKNEVCKTIFRRFDKIIISLLYPYLAFGKVRRNSRIESCLG